MTGSGSASKQSDERESDREVAKPFLVRFAVLAAGDNSSLSTRITRVAHETTDDE
jgi:hypothetical protein